MSLVDNILSTRYDTYNKIIKGDYIVQCDIEPCKFINTRQGLNMLLKHLKLGSNILIFADVDVDGILSCYVVHRYLRLLGHDMGKVSTYINEGKTHGVTDGLKEHNKGKDFTIIVDSSSNDIEDIRCLDGDVLVLDHHVVNHSNLLGNTNNGEYVIINSTLGNIEYKLSCGLVVYEFLHNFDKYVLKQDKLENSLLIQWALITMYTDVIDLDTDRFQYYVDKYLSVESDINTELYGLMVRIDKYTHSINKNFINFKLAPKINKYIRGNAGSTVLDILTKSRVIEFNDLELYNNMQQDAVTLGIDRVKECKDYVYADLGDDIHINYSGVIASKLVDKYKKSAIVYKENKGIIKGSFRGSCDLVDYLSYVRSFDNATADGHKEAFGFSCLLNDRDTIFNNLGSIELGKEVNHLITFGGNITQGILHVGSLKDLDVDGSLYRVGLINSRLSSKDDIIIYFNLDLTQASYTSNKAGTLYTYNIDGVTVKGFKEPTQGIKGVYAQLINNKLSLILIE